MAATRHKLAYKLSETKMRMMSYRIRFKRNTNWCHPAVNCTSQNVSKVKGAKAQAHVKSETPRTSDQLWYE